MGLPREQIDSSLRVSFSRENTEQDADALAEAVAEGLRTLAARRLKPRRG